MVSACTSFSHFCSTQNQKWPTSGPGGYITPAVWGVPYTKIFCWVGYLLGRLGRLST